MIFIYSKFRAAVSCFFIVLSGVGLVYSCHRQPVVACADDVDSVTVIDDFLGALDMFNSAVGIVEGHSFLGYSVIGLQQLQQAERGRHELIKMQDSGYTYTAPSGAGYIGQYSVYGDSTPRTVYLDSPSAGGGGRSLSWTVAYSNDFRVTATFDGAADIQYYSPGYNSNFLYGGFHGAMVAEAPGSITLDCDTDFFTDWSLFCPLVLQW